jgi:hypothetical protein
VDLGDPESWNVLAFGVREGLVEADQKGTAGGRALRRRTFSDHRGDSNRYVLPICPGDSLLHAPDESAAGGGMFLG